jgi:osmotically inducible protein OsmC
MQVRNGGEEMPFGFGSRFDDDDGATPEDLIGAALSGCFSMALAHNLAEASHAPAHIETTADVRLQKEPGGFAIDRIKLTCHARVPGIDEAELRQHAERTRKSCPVAKALTGTRIEVDARLFD